MLSIFYRFNVINNSQFKKKHIIFKESFYDKFVCGNENIVCNKLKGNTVSIQIKGKFLFAHNTQKINLGDILKKGFITSDGPLGTGVYCWDLKAENKGFHPKGTYLVCTITGLYEGEYLKCVFGYPKDEYLLLNADKISDLREYEK